MQVDRSNNSIGFMQIGVVTRVSATNGDFAPIAGIRFENTASTSIIRDINYSPSQVKCGVVAGVTTRITATGKVTNDTGLQTDVTIPTAAGTNVAPAVGDIVIRYVHTSGGAWTGGVGVLYHAHAEAA